MKQMGDGSVIQEYQDIGFHLAGLLIESARQSHFALQEMSKANQIQQERFHQLNDSLNEINSKMADNYSYLKPEGECFLSFAPNPISLFEEGVRIVAQHDKGSWRDVSDRNDGAEQSISNSLFIIDFKAFWRTTSKSGAFFAVRHPRNLSR
jgi:hypothetical protein